MISGVYSFLTGPIIIYSLRIYTDSAGQINIQTLED